MTGQMTEQELIDSFDEAVKDGHIFVTYQPKINHSTGRMIGAEALIPLTPDRVPFHVRYTLEHDETGKPLKAYGSATLVVDENNNAPKEKQA